MKTIGFATQFYTLWDVSEPYQKWINANEFYTCIDYNYIQNLSTDFGKSKAKLAGQKYKIDLDLKGEHSWSWQSVLKNNFMHWQFTWGKVKGQDIRTSNEIWHLQELISGYHTSRRNVYVRRRLIELGELVKYPHQAMQSYSDKEGNPVYKLQNYATPYYARLASAFEASEKIKLANSGHFYTNGERRELELWFVESFGYEGAYGYTFIMTFCDVTGKLFKYVGSNPPSLSYVDNEGNQHRDEFPHLRLTATIEHSNYKGLDETRLKRIKVLQVIPNENILAKQ